MYKRIVLITCSVWWMLAALGQAVSATKHISSADGLSNDFVLSLAVDKQGYVWAGTEAGVNRIAGKTIQPFLTSERTHYGSLLVRRGGADAAWHRARADCLQPSWRTDAATDV